MQTEFPREPGYAAAFFVGFRKRPVTGGPTERVGTVVVKRTYEIDPVARTVRPAGQAEDVLTADEVEDGVVRRESDVVPFKPEGDVVVLGFVARAGRHVLRVDDQDRLAQDVPASDPAADLFGWQPRTHTPRKQEAGTFSTDPQDYPPPWQPEDPTAEPNPLPADFGNRFFNGYLRAAALLAGQPFQPYLPTGAGIRIVRPAPPGQDNDYRFTLARDAPRATLQHHEGPGPDDERGWTRLPVALPADTLVIEPERNRCVLVWRGLWDADAIAEDRYRRLVVTGSSP